MAKHRTGITGGSSSSSSKAKNLGKGKVTPVQIAFIVDRYLADNHFASTLAAFRCEASDLFSKTKAKEVPKGLLGLGEMLDEYISLKEQRVVLDQEKRRVEMALHGMQEVLRAYHSAGPSPLPPSPPLLPPQFVATPVTPILPALYPSTSGSPPGHLVNGTPVMNYAQPPSTLLPHKSDLNNTSSMLSSSTGNKRKASRPSPTPPPSEPKKQRVQSPVVSSATEGVALTSQEAPTAKAQQKVELSSTTSFPTNNSPLQGSSAGNGSLKQPSDCQNNSSPKTPPQALQCQFDKSGSPMDITSLQTSHKPIGPSNCSIIASETIIVSPIKHTGYYAVERSYHIASPYKLNSKTKRGHIKGKLDFDAPIVATNVTTSSEEPMAVGSSTSSTEDEMSGSFDIDLPDLDIFNGDFSFSELLADIDLECEADPSFQPLSSFVHSVPSYEDNAGNGCSRSDQPPDSPLSTAIEVFSDKDVNLQGPDCVASVKTVTKFVKIVNPVPSRRNFS
ncbi:hypothetical protein OPV22_004634 [Ensete ventricosum]|uniref:LisH domain-containing protein n=1 Tax=Ensete ventricosum TaxID=4639 RepID=A0AAV8REU1_ENSVE|nr:hypothetical protein OPV22_004634 [Ensete ventricosum]